MNSISLKSTRNFIQIQFKCLFNLFVTILLRPGDMATVFNLRFMKKLEGSLSHCEIESKRVGRRKLKKFNWKVDKESSQSSGKWIRSENSCSMNCWTCLIRTCLVWLPEAFKIIFHQTSFDEHTNNKPLSVQLRGDVKRRSNLSEHQNHW